MAAAAAAAAVIVDFDFDFVVALAVVVLLQLLAEKETILAPLNAFGGQNWSSSQDSPLRRRYPTTKNFFAPSANACASCKNRAAAVVVAVVVVAESEAAGGR